MGEDGVYGTRCRCGTRAQYHPGTSDGRTGRVKKEGKMLRRPRVIVDREKVRQLHGQGSSVRIIAAQLGLTKSTVHSIIVA